MKRFLGAFLCVLALCLAASASAEKLTLPAGTEVKVNFTPGQTVATAIVAAIRAEKTGILVQAYGFNDPDIGAALIETHKRGVAVVAVLGRKANTGKNAKRSQGPVLAAAGIPVVYDGAHPIAHNKVMVFLGQGLVGFGSYNFTPSAKRNAENFALIRSPELARIYVGNVHVHEGHSREP